MAPTQAPRTPALAHTSSLDTEPHAQQTRTPLHPAALASVPYGILLVRVRVRFGPNGPENQALGRLASMLRRTDSRGRYSAKFRSTLYVLETISLQVYLGK